MKWLEAKREAKAMTGPADNKADKGPGESKAEEWTYSISPEAYLERWPDGPGADLARRIMEKDS